MDNDGIMMDYDRIISRIIMDTSGIMMSGL